MLFQSLKDFQRARYSLLLCLRFSQIPVSLHSLLTVHGKSLAVMANGKMFFPTFAALHMHAHPPSWLPLQLDQTA